MKALFFVDVHANKEKLDKLIKKSDDADLLVCAGDLSKLGSGFGESAEKLDNIGKKVLIIPGNNETPEFIKEAVEELENFIYIEREVYEDEGIKFLGIGSCLPSPFDTPYELSDEQIWNILKEFKKVNVLASHNPPKNTILDKTLSGLNIGSFSIRKWIEKNQPKYCCCGHVHENAGKEIKIGDTLVFNPGPEGRIINL